MRTLLLGLLGFVAITSISSGIVLMLQPDHPFGMTSSLLENTFFSNYFIPGFILTMIVGGSNLTAFYYNYKQKQVTFGWTLIAGMTIAGWIVVQISMIREFFWLQWVYLLAGFFILLMALQLKHKELI